MELKALSKGARQLRMRPALFGQCGALSKCAWQPHVQPGPRLRALRPVLAVSDTALFKDLGARSRSHAEVSSAGSASYWFLKINTEVRSGDTHGGLAVVAKGPRWGQTAPQAKPSRSPQADPTTGIWRLKLALQDPEVLSHLRSRPMGTDGHTRHHSNPHCPCLQVSFA